MKPDSLQQKTLETLQQEKAKVVKEFQRCSGDPEYFISTKCYVLNPDRPSGQRIIPFVLWPHQTRLLGQLMKYQDTFSEKSRDMGISWLIMAFELHQALFTEYFTALNISRAEREVQDSGNTFHSLMGRMAFMYDRLPSYLRLKVHNPFLTFQVLATGSVIKGESANKNAGRDTQYKFVFVDEAAHIEVFSEMWKALRNSSDCILVNSTPPDDITDNKYVDLKNLTGSGFKFMRFHWKEHPEKNQEWYKKKTASLTQEEIDQELDIGYKRTKTEKSYLEYSDDIHRSRHKFYYNKSYPLITGHDFGLGGEVIEFFQQDKDKRLFLLYVYEKKNALTPEHWRNFIHILGELRYKGKISDIIAIGDPFSGKRRDRTSGKSVIEEYSAISKGALKIQTKHVGFEEKRRCVKALLKDQVNGKPKFQASVTCEDFSKAMMRIRMNKQGSDHIDDWTTHKVNAFEYVVTNFYPVLKAEMVNISISPEGRIEGEEEEKKSELGSNIIVPYRSSLRSIIDRNRISRGRLI